MKERLSYRLIKWALSRMDIVFSSDWMRTLWLDAYGFDQQKTHVIENAIEEKLGSILPTRKNFRDKTNR